MAVAEHALAAGLSFALTDEQKALRDLAHEFAEKEIRPRATDYDEHMTHPADVIAKAHEVGLMNLNIPADYGGPELGLLEGTLVGEEPAGAVPASALLLRAGPRSSSGRHRRHGRSEAQVAPAADGGAAVAVLRADRAWTRAPMWRG